MRSRSGAAGAVSYYAGRRVSREFFYDDDDDVVPILPRLELDDSTVMRSSAREIFIRVNFLQYFAHTQEYTAREIRAAFRRGISKAVTVISRRYRQEVKARCPVRTGRMRRSVKVKREKASTANLTGWKLYIDARDPPSRGGEKVFYFYIVDSRRGMTEDTFLSIRTWAIRIFQEHLNAELDRIRR